MLRDCLIILSVFLIVSYAGNSAIVNWSTNNTIFKAGNLNTNGGILTVITSSTNKSGGATATYASAFSASPKLVVGICNLESMAGNQVEITFSGNTIRSSSNFTLNYVIGSTTVVNVLRYSYLGILNTLTSFDTYIDALFSGLVGTTQSNFFVI